MRLEVRQYRERIGWLRRFADRFRSGKLQWSASRVTFGVARYRWQRQQQLVFEQIRDSQRSLGDDHRFQPILFHRALGAGFTLNQSEFEFTLKGHRKRPHTALTFERHRRFHFARNAMPAASRLNKVQLKSHLPARIRQHGREALATRQWQHALQTHALFGACERVDVFGIPAGHKRGSLL